MRNRIRYVPGLLSLLILPVVLYGFKEYNRDRPKMRTLEVNWWHPDLLKSSHYQSISIPPKRDYQKVHLTGNGPHDKIKLDFSKVRMLEMRSNNEFNGGIHFQFGDTSKYESFVKTLEIIESADHRYLAYGNDIWAFPFPDDYEDRKPLPRMCGTMFNTRVINIEMGLKEKIVMIFKIAGPLLLTYSLLFVISFISVVKKFKSHPVH